MPIRTEGMAPIDRLIDSIDSRPRPRLRGTRSKAKTALHMSFGWSAQSHRPAGAKARHVFVRRPPVRLISWFKGAGRVASKPMHMRTIKALEDTASIAQLSSEFGRKAIEPRCIHVVSMTPVLGSRPSAALHLLFFWGDGALHGAKMVGADGLASRERPGLLGSTGRLKRHCYPLRAYVINLPEQSARFALGPGHGGT